jgi:NADPH2:quinone reductase
MAPAPHTVRAARLHQHGEPLVVERVELAAPGVDEVRVELEFGGVNPIDTYTAQGRVGADGPLPRTLGGEAAGTAGGRAVLVSGGGLGAVRDGVWAQAAVVPAHAVTAIPAGVSTQHAGAMGIAGLTALKVVRDLARVTGEDRVLVLGASGGVGSMIVSLARAAGAVVWGQTRSAQKVAGITEQGAGRVVVGGADELLELIETLKPTVVFDGLGDGFVAPVLEAIAPLGRIVSFGTSAGPQVTFNMQLLYRKMVSLVGYGGMNLAPQERDAGLRAAMEAVADGSIRVRIDEILALERVNDAFARLRDHRVEGKLLLDLR